MLNQVILVGKLVDMKEEIVDNGTHAVILILDTGNATVPVWTRDGVANNCRTFLKMGATIGAKCRLHNAPQGLNVVGEKITFISGGKQ